MTTARSSPSTLPTPSRPPWVWTPSSLETADDDAGPLRVRAGGYRVERTESGLTVFVEDEEAAVGAMVAAVGVPVRTVRAHRPTLDDVFLHYTGREIRDQHGEGAISMFARVARRPPVKEVAPR